MIRRWWPFPRPVPKPQPAPSPTPGPAPGTTTDRLLAAHNEERARNGLPALVLNVFLCASAQSHSSDMANRGVLDHNGSDGISPFDRMKRAGYVGNSMGENIAEGQQTISSVMSAWMGSLGHRQNILSSNYKNVGFGVAYRGDTSYWTADFGG